MKISYSISTICLFLFGVFIFSTLTVSGVNSMYPYDPDPAVAAEGKKAADEKSADAEELTGDALKEKVFADPTSIEAGQLRFAQSCSAYCHGDKGAGGEVAPLQCQVEYTPEYVFAVITEGRKAGSRYMPSWKDTYSEKERWELAAFIMSLKNLPKCKE